MELELVNVLKVTEPKKYTNGVIKINNNIIPSKY
jgi:hypothetical protein